MSRHPSVVIVAGGRGTRVRSITGGAPKATIPARGQPFIHHVLDRLVSCGVTHVHLALGHGAPAVLTEVGQRADVNISHTIEARPLGVVGAVVQALDNVPGDAFVVLYGDVYPANDVAELVDAHCRSAAAVTAAVSSDADADELFNLSVEAGVVSAYGGSSHAHTHLDIGMSVVSRGALTPYSPGSSVDEATFFADLIGGKRLFAHEYPRANPHIGNPSALRRFESSALELLRNVPRSSAPTAIASTSG